MHSPGLGYALPRLFLFKGRYMSLQKALRRGADPLALLVEDGAGGWRPYIEPRPPAQPRRLQVPR
jgi:hypothetical protein